MVNKGARSGGSVMALKRKKANYGGEKGKSMKNNVLKTATGFLLKKKKLKRKKRFSKEEEEDKSLSLLDESLKSSSHEEELELDLDSIVPVKQGDRIDMIELLFTKRRDFLLKSNSKQLVKAKDLLGKTIVIFFADLRHNGWLKSCFHLMDVYDQIHHKYPFEVVLVPFTRSPLRVSNRFPPVDPHHRFTSIFSSMPWTAVPYSDFTSCQRLLKTFRHSGYDMPDTPVIDPDGVVLHLGASSLFESFGSLAYPFTMQRINLLVSEDKAVLENPSIWNLLASPDRDYVISNNGRQVHIQSLEHKVVALHFIEEAHCPSYSNLTAKLMTAYEQLVHTENFEVVLIYVHDTSARLRRTKEETFWKKFKRMPWLALPFKDPFINKLMRLCHYPLDLDGLDPDPRLVIVGPRGEYFEPYGADIFMNYGVPAYPFSRRKLVDLIAGKAKSVKLDMLWDSNSVLRRRDKSEVKVSEVAGKGIILLIGIDWVKTFAGSLSILKSKYDLLKGTDDEFEVIQIYNLSELSDYGEHVADVPWLVHPCDEDSPGVSLLLHASGDARLLAFNHRGKVVRRATIPQGGLNIPFLC